MTGIVDDLVRLQEGLADQRIHFESVWSDLIALTRPSMKQQYLFSSGAYGRPGIATLSGSARNYVDTKATGDLYNSTLGWAADRLSAGMESLISPRSQKWHGMSLDDPFAPEPTDVEEEFLDKTRDYLFQSRYDAKAGFALANQKAIWETSVLGTGVIFTEENIGQRNVDVRKCPVFYRHIPLPEIFLGIDAYGQPDRAVRIHEMPAIAAVRYFGEENLSPRVKAMADDTRRANEIVAFGFAALPREQAEGWQSKKSALPIATFAWEIDTKHLVRHGGYREFPFHVMYWDQFGTSPWGYSPAMNILPEAKMLQIMGKATVKTMQQWFAPPLARHASGLTNRRLNMNPNAVNDGYVNEQGQLLVRPILTAQDPRAALELIRDRENIVKQGMNVDLFQILIDNPQMTATEAMIRNTEKGQLLGPAGAKMESAYGDMVDREISILNVKGAFEAGSPMEAPQSIAGKNIGVKFTGPLARLRRMEEMNGIQTVMQMAGLIGQYDQSILDRIDGDETLEIVREVAGAPRRTFRTDEEVEASRQARAQQQEAMAALQMGQMAADAANKATPAFEALAAAQ